MAKKRVYEIAKELQKQGVEIDSKELLKELREIGFDVKTSSASLDEQDAASAMKKIIQKKKGAPPPLKAVGPVLRRRASSANTPVVKAPAAQTASSSSTQAAARPAAAVHRVPAPSALKASPEAVKKNSASDEAQVKAPAAPPSASKAEQPRDAAQPAAAAVKDSDSPAQPKVSAEQPASPAKSDSSDAAVQAAQPLADKSEAVQAASSASASDSESGVQKSEKKDADTPADVNVGAADSAAAPSGASAGASASSESEKGAQNVRETASAAQTKAPVQEKQHAVRPGSETKTSGSAVKAPAQPQSVDPKTLHPTANRAVRLDRPLIPIPRRAPSSPSSDPMRRSPQTPGQRTMNTPSRESPSSSRFGPPAGGAPSGRRDYDSGSERGGRRGSRVRQDAKENYSKQELMELARDPSGSRFTTVVPRVGKKKKALKKGIKPQITQMAEEKKVVKVDESVSIADLSQKMGVKAAELMRKLIGLGMMVNINSPLDIDTASLLVSDYGWRIEKTGFEIEDYITDVPNAPEDLVSRPPVVTIMGHVDHGKTSLLDAIRNARVAAGEAGGITQHIGAYSVETEDGRKVTFLDTPGHEAFTAMRARGAKVTDLVVIVVAADDGVMPQTREAINHAKAADVPILVAINKIDKPGANPERVKNQLMEFGLVDESLGGDTIMVPVSAKTKVGLDNLLEMILLQSEVLDLKANPDRKAHGTVVEAKLEKGRGPVATVIVSDGTLHTGDALVTGNSFGRIRAMQNDKGEKVSEVLPGFPVEIVGLDSVPTAGDEFDVVESEAAAKEIASHRLEKERQKELSTSAKMRLEDLFSKANEGALKELRLVVKADVQGSAEAVSASLEKLTTKKVSVKIIHSGVGGINGNDVMLAAASDAIIVGFNVRPELKAAELAAEQGVDIRLYSIIYEAVDEVQKAMAGLLEPTKKEKALGRAEVRNIFTVPKVGTIAGCFVMDGKVVRSAQARVLRDSKVIYTGKIASLRRFKDDVKEVEKGYECGLSIENFNDIKQGDVIEVFEIEIIRPSLD